MGTSRMVTAVPFTVGRGPELKPLRVALKSCDGIQGAANSDWITSYVPLVTVEKTNCQFSLLDKFRQPYLIDRNRD